MFKKILSLDQALNLTGFAIYDNKELILHGTFNLKDIKGDNSVEEKVSNVKKFLEKIIADYEIDLVVLEDVQSQVNVNTFKQLAWLQGTLINFLYEHKYCHLIVKPSEWRSIIVGSRFCFVRSLFTGSRRRQKPEEKCGHLEILRADGSRILF